jgi:hypothetical protein
LDCFVACAPRNDEQLGLEDFMLTKTPHLFDDATQVTAGDSRWQGKTSRITGPLSARSAAPPPPPSCGR